MKRLVAIGDSIVHGTCSKEPFGLVEENYIKIIGQFYNFDDIINYGINGTTVCPKTDWRPTLAACLYVDEMLPADLAFISCGTNDYGKNIAIGNIDDTNENTFCGSLNILFNKAVKRFKEIIYLTPIPRYNENKNEKGYTLDDYRKAIKEVGYKYKIIVLDGKKVILDKKLHLPDGLHPNSFGHKKIAKFIIAELTKLNESI